MFLSTAKLKYKHKKSMKIRAEHTNKNEMNGHQKTKEKITVRI